MMRSDVFIFVLFMACCCLFTVKSFTFSTFTTISPRSKVLTRAIFQSQKRQNLGLYMNIDSTATSSSSHPFIRPILTENDFNILKDDTANGIVVIEFQKGNCKPCKKVAPLFDALANKYHDRATFCRMDAENGKETMQAMKKIGVKSVPTFYVYRNRERVDSISGARLDDLEMLINQELNKQ